VIWEISISGQAASSSSPTFMILGRDSTTAATNAASTGQTDTSINSEGTFGTLPLTFSSNTTTPQRSASLHMQNCSLNAFGGNYFWRANRMEESPLLYGNAANVGEASLSAYTGGTTGAIGVHMIYEPM
jgi:hypothetical protein